MADVQEESVQTKHKRLKLKDWWPVLVFIVLVLILALVLGLFIDKRQYDGPTSRVLVTSSKITGLDGYTRVYSDEASDYAVYIRNEYSAAQIPTGWNVQVGALTGTVDETHDSYFIVSGIQSSTPILPGTAVYYNGVAFGFVSSQTGGVLTCRYY